jgi:membrane dipeptidase
MIDVSHASDKTLTDVLAASRAPVIASHSCARALCGSARNLTDDQLRALAAKGGLCMVNFYAAFVDENYRQAVQTIRAERSAEHEALVAEYAAKKEPVPFHKANQIDRDFAGRLTRPPFQSLIDQFDHIIRVAGVDHVGIGTDFDGISAMPEGVDSAADLPKITAVLLDRGYSADELRKVLGGNLMRVFSEIQNACLPRPT